MVTKEQIEALIALIKANKDADFRRRGYTMAPPTFTYMMGTKYARIVMVDSGKSAYCFVDLSNGDILKTASWATPAKGARSNINDSDGGMSGLGPYGAVYNRGHGYGWAA